ncbi:MAG TPA: hypothetical protein PKJ45_06845, partial [Rubrivivax sp.]|nr:hypothetical protein [Rubrivivax sp.]
MPGMLGVWHGLATLRLGVFLESTLQSGRTRHGAPHRPALATKEKPLQIRDLQRLFEEMAEWTGLEPATPGVTGRY